MAGSLHLERARANLVHFGRRSFLDSVIRRGIIDVSPPDAADIQTVEDLIENEGFHELRSGSVPSSSQGRRR